MKPLILVAIAPVALAALAGLGDREKLFSNYLLLSPFIGHIPLTLEPAAVQAAIAAVRSMNEPRR